MPIPTKPTKSERTTLREEVAQRIRAAIFDGTLQPGEILHDAALQDWLGVSRTPIREALNELARLGLIEMVPQKHTRVAEPRPEDRTLVLQTLGALVGGVVRITVPVLSERQSTALRAETDKLITVVGRRDAVQHGRDGWRLVDRFIDYCPNHVLVKATKDTIDSLAYQLGVTRTDESTNWDDLDVGYPALLDALAVGDAIAAELAIERVFRLSSTLP